MAKIGVGIVTCDRPKFLSKCIGSISNCIFDCLVVVNDGYDDLKTPVPVSADVIRTTGRTGVAKAKNIALKKLFENGCEYFFLIEDDMIVLQDIIFQKYIQLHQASGIHHFNYGPGSPFNRKQTIKNYDLHNRHLLDQKSEPNPRLIIDYGNNNKLSLFEHTVAMFSFYTRTCLDEVGFIDENFYNAWEHVDHTYRIIKAGLHPPFWYFADLYNSHEYLTEAPDAINESSIANDNEQWNKNIMEGREFYLQKHGHYPNMPPYLSKENVLLKIKDLKSNVS